MKYFDDKNMEWSMSNKIWKEDKEQVIRIRLYFFQQKNKQKCMKYDKEEGM